MEYLNWNLLKRNSQIAILGFLMIVFAGLACKNPGNNTAENSAISQVDNTANGVPKADSAGNTGSNPAFSFQPEKPVDGKLMGVVEVGASGFNAFVVSIDKQKRWEIVTQDFGQSLVYEGLATADDISKGLQNYVSFMSGNGVDRKNMHFLISSGAQKEPKTKAIAAELKKIGFAVILVSPQQEGEWALKCILPDTFSTKAFVTDIGSGNTKLAWRNGNKIEVLEAPGSKYYEKDMKNEDVYNKIKSMAAGIPAGKTEVCFIMGGAPYDLVKQHRNGEERYTVMKNPEEYTATKPKSKAGINIYKAVKDATGCKIFVFDWNGNFTIGYLLELAG